jgi:hypothetical protein
LYFAALKKAQTKVSGLESCKGCLTGARGAKLPPWGAKLPLGKGDAEGSEEHTHNYLPFLSHMHLALIIIIYLFFLASRNLPVARATPRRSES